MGILLDYAENNDKMNRALCAKSGISLPALKLCIPGGLAPLLDGADTRVGTPAGSAVSTPSLNLDRLTMDSPVDQSMGPPIAGPSGHGRNEPRTKGAPSHTLFDHFLTSIFDAASMPNLRSSSRQRKASGPASKAASVAGSRRTSRTRNK